MRRSLEERILKDINTLLENLNKKIDQLISVQCWLNNFKKEVKEDPKITPGVI